MGSAAKRKSIQLLLRRQRCGMAIFQETKLEFIDEKVVKQGVEDWRCGIIGLYAPFVVTEQREFWEKVVTIILEKNVAWCVGGDFNMVRCVDERRGCVIGRREISDFCNFVEVAALSDVLLQGKLFTWFGSGNKCGQLDRFLVSTDWFQRFDSLVVINLPRELSDHSPIMLVSDVCDSGPKPFRFLKRG
ncbi:hypothetical protein V6N13_102172 [Hibiscus sabdariffa]